MASKELRKSLNTKSIFHRLIVSVKYTVMESLLFTKLLHELILRHILQSKQFHFDINVSHLFSVVFGVNNCSALHGICLRPATQPRLSPLLDVSREKEKHRYSLPVHC